MNLLRLSLNLLRRDWRVGESRAFLSMVAHREQTLLSEIQAVGAGYPLRGRIEIDDGAGSTPSLTLPLHGGGDAVGKVVSRGTVWVDGRLLRQLDAHVGDEVGIGTLRFTVAARIVRDIDRAVGFYSFAPRVLMNGDDLAATGLLQEGSRIVYRLMVAGEAGQVEALRDDLKPGLSNGEKLEDVRDARPEIRTAL